MTIERSAFGAAMSQAGAAQVAADLERLVQQHNAVPSRADDMADVPSMLSTAELVDGRRVLPTTKPRTAP